MQRKEITLVLLAHCCSALWYIVLLSLKVSLTSKAHIVLDHNRGGQVNVERNWHWVLKSLYTRFTLAKYQKIESSFLQCSVPDAYCQFSQQACTNFYVNILAFIDINPCMLTTNLHCPINQPISLYQNKYEYKCVCMKLVHAWWKNW